MICRLYTEWCTIPADGASLLPIFAFAPAAADGRGGGGSGPGRSTPFSRTPDSLPQAGGGGSGGGAGAASIAAAAAEDWRSSRGRDDIPAPDRPLLQQPHQLWPHQQAGAAGLDHRLRHLAPTLAADLFTSPEFLVSLPPQQPGSPAGGSISQSSSSIDGAPPHARLPACLPASSLLHAPCCLLCPHRCVWLVSPWHPASTPPPPPSQRGCHSADAGSLPSRGLSLSVRRFPTLDSWGSQQQQQQQLLDGAASKPGLSRLDSLAAMAAQRFTNMFGQQQQPAAVAAMAAVATEIAEQEEQGVRGLPPPTQQRGLRKRQHNSSRRALMSMIGGAALLEGGGAQPPLSRDNSVASSIDGLQPAGKTRHLLAPHEQQQEGGGSPDGDDDGDDSLGEGGGGGWASPTFADSDAYRTHSPLPPRPLARSSGSLSREMGAGDGSGGGTPGCRQLHPLARSSGSGVQLQPGGDFVHGFGTAAAAAEMQAVAQPPPALLLPPLPLHARLTCMQLRDAE